MTRLEDRIRDALHASAELPVSQQDLEEAVARFQSRRVASAQRPRALLVAATAALMVAALLVWWLARPAADHPEPTNRPAPPLPTQTQSPTDDRVGIIGPPPPGTAPTGPATGKLVAGAELYNTVSLVYADGRLINAMHNQVTSDQFTGFVVRQLTPSGVEAMRSYMLEGTARLTSGTTGPLIVREGGRLMTAQAFTDCGQRSDELPAGLPEDQTHLCAAFDHPEEWLPASAWEDPTYRPFVPHTYEVCLFSPQDSAVLPAAAADIFLAGPNRGGLGGEEDCRTIATADARTIADAVEEAGAASVGDQQLVLDLRTLGGRDNLWFAPILPNDRGSCLDCG